MRVKNTADAAKRFSTRAAAAQGDYAAGVVAGAADWEKNTAAAGDNYAQGVNEAVSQGRFARGVAAAGAGKYADKASKVGAGRFAQGVQGAAGDWQKGTQPYIDTLAGMTLPPRGPKGSPSNMLRVQAVAAALRAKKVGQ